MDNLHTSVIIATYNRGPDIEPTLLSVLEQTTPADEIIVVDDGSTDNTADWIQAHFSQVRLVKKPNGGTSSARNFGARQAKNGVLVFLDHDDVLYPHALATLRELLKTFPEAVAAHCDHEYQDVQRGIHHANHHYMLPAFKRLLSTPSLKQVGNARLYGRPLYGMLLWGNLLQQPWAVRTTAFKEVGGFSEDIRYCEDWDIYLQITQRFPVVVADTVISRHIIEGQNLHLTIAEKQEVMYARVLQRRLATHQRKDWRESLTVRKKMASQEKGCGDRAMAAGDTRLAWLCYWRSANWWPQDYVTLVRLLTWSPLVYPLLKSLRHKLSRR